MIHSHFALARILFLAMPGAQWGQGKSSWARSLGELATCRAAELIAEGDVHASVFEHISMSLEDQASKNLGKDLQQQKLWALDQANTWVDLDPREYIMFVHKMKFQVPYKVMLTW